MASLSNVGVFWGSTSACVMGGSGFGASLGINSFLVALDVWLLGGLVGDVRKKSMGVSFSEKGVAVTLGCMSCAINNKTSTNDSSATGAEIT